MYRVSMPVLKNIILRLLSQGHPSIEQAAEQLGVSSRTLQRKIAKENMCYSQLVEAIRYEEARRLLTYSKLNIRDISGLLGYADAGSFTRAFIRWYGKGPKNYRVAHKVKKQPKMEKKFIPLSKYGAI